MNNNFYQWQTATIEDLSKALCFSVVITFENGEEGPYYFNKENIMLISSPEINMVEIYINTLGTPAPIGPKIFNITDVEVLKECKVETTCVFCMQAINDELSPTKVEND